MGLRPTHELCKVGGGLRARHQPGQVVRTRPTKLMKVSGRASAPADGAADGAQCAPYIN